MTTLAILSFEAVSFVAAFALGTLAERHTGSNSAGMYAFLGTLAATFFAGVAIF